MVGGAFALTEGHLNPYGVRPQPRISHDGVPAALGLGPRVSLV